MNAGTIGTIDLAAKGCVIEVERLVASRVIQSLDGAPFKGRPLRLKIMPGRNALPAEEDTPSTRPVKETTKIRKARKPRDGKGQYRRGKPR